MSSLKILSAAAALALTLPLAAPTASFAQSRDPAGGGFHGGGGAGFAGGGGGFAGAARGPANVGAAPAMRSGGSFAAAPAMRTADPAGGFASRSVAAAGPTGTWNRGGNWHGGNWNGGGWNGGRWHHRHGGFWPGFAAGATVGALGSYAYYGDPYYYGDTYYDDSYYYDQGPTVAVGTEIGGDSVGYCARRYRSYDPASGTYLGYDGLRHPCP